MQPQDFAFSLPMNGKGVKTVVFTHCIPPKIFLPKLDKLPLIP